MQMLPFAESLREEQSEIECRIKRLRQDIEEQLRMLKAVRRGIELAEKEPASDVIELPGEAQYERPARICVEVAVSRSRRVRSLN
ncbi:MAG: hypothetical protein AAGF33_17695 [Pseudomonadota bacterium]